MTLFYYQEQIPCANQGFCYLNLAGKIKLKYERKNEKVSGRSNKMVPQGKICLGYLYDNVHLASFGRNLNLLLNTRWPAKIAFRSDSVRRVLTNRRSTLHSDRSKLEFGSSHEKLDFWATPKPFASMFQQRIENASTGGTRSSHPLIFQDQAHLIFRRNLFPGAFSQETGRRV